MQEGKGFKEYLEHIRKVRAGETIPLPTPSSQINEAGSGGLKRKYSEARERQMRYGTAISFNAHTPYCSMPVDSNGTEESLDDNNYFASTESDKVQSEQVIEEFVEVYIPCYDESGQEIKGFVEDNRVTYMDNDQNGPNSSFDANI